MNSDTWNILGINTSFESINYQGLIHGEFRSATSFMDYDAVLIDTSYLARHYETDSCLFFEGKRMISEDESCSIVEEYSLIKSQLIELLKQGKNVFVLMATNENCFIYDKTKELGRTGKRLRGIYPVKEFDMFSFLPIDLKPIMVSGEKFNITCQPPYSTFFQITKDMVYYDAYFEAPKKSSLLTLPNSDKSISAVFEYEKGKIILLPYPYDEGYFDAEKEWKKCAKKYLDALFELNHALCSKSDSYELPLWSSNVKILNEEDAENKLEQEMKELQSIQDKIKHRQEEIKSIQKKKILITASGTPLEEVVQETLQEIGFTLSETEVGRSDIIASYNGTDIVAEIKGVSKSAAEKHAAQLEKWVAQFIEEKEHAPKPILIVNGYCDIPLAERVEDVFPNQMLKYCEARGHALVTTTQLLCLYIEIKKNPACAEERIAELLSCVGKYQRYDDYNKYIQLIGEEESKENE